MPAVPSISVIIPTRNEALGIGETVCYARLQAGCSPSPEILVVDGGSSDRTVAAARAAGARTLVIHGGRAAQLNAAARAASGSILFFLHADSRPPPAYGGHIRKTLAIPGTVAGAFRLHIASDRFGIRLVQYLANIRASMFQLPYGDQGLFLTRLNFDAVGGYPGLPFMDDYAMSRKLARHGRVRIANSAVVTSGRRWETLGVFRTTVINQVIIIGYNLGIPVPSLQAWYYGAFTRALSSRGN
jgi:rSAM/selenodomain-associated transferase 2